MQRKRGRPAVIGVISALAVIGALAAPAFLSETTQVGSLGSPEGHGLTKGTITSSPVQRIDYTFDQDISNGGGASGTSVNDTTDFGFTTSGGADFAPSGPCTIQADGVTV